MARLLTERESSVHPKREFTGNSQPAMSSTASEFLRELGCNFSDAELRETAYKTSVVACRTTSDKPLSFIPQTGKVATPPPTERLPSLSMQRSMTLTAAGEMMKGPGLKPLKKSPGKDSSPSKTVKRPAKVGELVKMQMGVPEQTDQRERSRISASQEEMDGG